MGCRSRRCSGSALARALGRPEGRIRRTGEKSFGETWQRSRVIEAAGVTALEQRRVAAARSASGLRILFFNGLLRPDGHFHDSVQAFSEDAIAFGNLREGKRVREQRPGIETP